MPARFTLVMFIPNELRSLRSPSFTPLISDLVTRIFRETSWLSMAFQSMSPLFQSTFSCGPNISVILSASFLAEITNMCSFSSMTVSPVGMITLPSFHIREMTNWHSALWRMSCMLFPKMSGLVTMCSVINVLSDDLPDGLMLRPDEVVFCIMATQITMHIRPNG